MTVDSKILAAVGSASSPFDIRLTLRRCYFFDFNGYPVRLWQGMGKLFADSQEWLGTINGDGVDGLSAPSLRDMRDSTNPRYEFSMPYIDATTFDSLKADVDLAKGRNLLVYNVVCQGDLRPTDALRFNRRLVMRSVQFSDSYAEPEPGRIVRQYKATVLCRGITESRSLAKQGTYTSTSQAERASYYGESSDSGCDFVAGNANRTFTID